MKKIVALLLVVLASLSFCACAEEPETAVVGDWEMKIDMSNILSGELGTTGLDATRLGERWEVFCDLKFDEERNYTLSLNVDATKASFERYLAALKTLLTDTLYQSFGAGFSKEEADAVFKAQTDMTIAEFIDTMFDELLDVDALMRNLAVEPETGLFKVEDDKLYLPADSEDCFTFTVAENVLTLTGMEGDPLDISEMLDANVLAFPIELTK